MAIKTFLILASLAAGAACMPEAGLLSSAVYAGNAAPRGVAKKISDKEAVRRDLASINIPGGVVNRRSDMRLPAETENGSILIWSSDNPSYVDNAGNILKLAPAGGSPVEVTLTATAVKNKAKGKRTFQVTVAPEEDYDSYLFTYFPSNSDENLYYAISTDGFNYTPLNGGKMVMSSDTVARKKGIRDPHILRGNDGKTFYMVATDMKSAEGWASNRGIVMYKSDDLVNWTHHTVHFPDRFPEWKNVTRVWAPEVIWDPDYENADGSKGRYLVYFSLLTDDGKCEYDKIYYCYANDDFSDLMTDPVYFYDRGSATIDGDIAYDERTGLYHMVYKNEGTGGICQVTARRLTAEPGKEPGSQWSEPSGTLQQTNVAVEGGGMFRLINSDDWVLMYDCYGNGYYQFCTSDDLENFKLKAQTVTKGAFTPRHGTVIPLHPEETKRVLEAFPVVKPEITGSMNPNLRQDWTTYGGTGLKLPVRYGTDLKSLDPKLTATPGWTLEPKGAKDFTKGPVKYTVTDGKEKRTFDVSAEVNANPVIPGFHADPEILFSNKTGRFYLYPTTDGLRGWGGHTFDVFSSPDLVNWRKETCILDLKTDDVKWANGNGWAPCIEEKLENGEYKYYFYFSGHNPEKDYKVLGCAVADSPTGPFKDLGHPLIDTNITRGQLIDSDVFTDPVSGQTYYYWGNGRLVASKLGKDMKTITDAVDITPEGGTLDDYAFREGVYVFYRDGLYYFLWSVDDTGSPNYHVAYGTSKSPMGPIEVAKNPVILRQDPKNGIYGTAHNSVVKIPGRDEWYIVYHRINKDYINKEPGTHREVCIDKMEFNPDGTIKPVVPTNKGISPVVMSNLLDNWTTIKKSGK